MQQGLGKTLTALYLFKRLQALGVVQSCLVIAPLRVAKYTWPAEISKWYDDIDYVVIHGKAKQFLYQYADKDLWVINYEGLPGVMNRGGPIRNSFHRFLEKGTFVIVDESSYIRNASAQRTRLIGRICVMSNARVLLSGTPAPNSLENLWSQILMLDFGRRLETSLGEFRHRYSQQYQIGDGIYKRGYNEDSCKAVTEKIKDVMISMNTRDHLDIPPVTHVRVPIQLPKRLEKEYQQLEDGMMQIINDIDEKKITTVAMSTASVKCRQMASGFLYQDKELTGVPVLEKHNEKIEALKTIMEQCDEDPVLVYFNFKYERDQILKHCGGEVLSAESDDDIINRWNRKEIPLLLANPASAGHGLNLQEGGHIGVWYSPTFDLELWLQANTRLDRPGQTHPVTFYHLHVIATIEDRVTRRILEKDVSQKRILEAVRAE